MTMRRKMSLTATAVGAALLLGGCGTQLPDARPSFGYSGLLENETGLSSYDQGKVDFAAGRYGLAAKRFRLAMAEAPDSLEAVNGLAASYDQIGRFDLAERFYRRALAMDPNSAQTLNNLGYSLMLQGKNDLALALFRDATRRDPDNAMIAANAQLAVAARVETGAAQRDAAAQAAQAPEAARKEAADRRPPAKRPSIIRITAAEQRLRLRTAPTPPQVTAVPLPAVESQPLPALPLPAKSDAAVPTPATKPIVRVALKVSGSDVTLPAGPSEVSARPDPRAIVGTVEVANGTGRRHMAARMKAYLSSMGLPTARLSNADHFAHGVTIVTYLPGHRDLAEVLSASLPIVPQLQQVTGQVAGVRVELGGDLLEFDRSLLQAERKTSHADPV